MNVQLPQTSTPARVWPPATQAEYDRVREAAIDQALTLRRAAIDDFWHAGGELLADAVDRGRRAADRLAARLRQHAKQRGAAPAASEL